MKRKVSNRNCAVLVGVLKSKRDLRILLKKRWYRIPMAFLPRRSFACIAFYQPAIFGTHGKRIELYGRVMRSEEVKRIELLPKEKSHPRAHEKYLKVEFSQIKKLPRPIKNVIPRRVSFGFTTLKKLLVSRNILELYGVLPTEQIIEKRLACLDIQTRREYSISKSGKRCRIDLAIFCNNGSIAIECDNQKAHARKIQRLKDGAKDVFLKHLGWSVVRLKEKDIIERPDHCTNRIAKVINSLGGLQS